MKLTFSRSLAALALTTTLHAHAQLVVIANPAAEALSPNQVADIFLGRNKAFTPFNQIESAHIREEFYEKATGRDPGQVKAIWARLVFTGKASMPKELADSAAVKKAVAADPKAIGYVEKSAVESGVKVVLTLE